MKHQRSLVASLQGVHDEYMLTVPDVAAILNVDQSKARELIATAKMRGGIRVGKLWRIPAGKVRAWIDAESLPQNSNIADIRARTRRRQ